ncbi:MAG: hypothetical protein HYX23_02005 [Candidatus Zambryskibacteria bacterium]|nr:hypothetical protein [Candidatus Zambryskibacteria bacterium]
MNDDIRDEDEVEEEDSDLKSTHNIKKSKDVMDEETDSIDDLADDELALDKEDLMDDIEEM